MPRSTAAPIDLEPKRGPSRRSGRIIGLALLATVTLAGCQSTVDGPRPVAAGSSTTTQQAQPSAPGQVQLAVPIELRGVVRQYQCSAPTPPAPSSVPPSGFGLRGQAGSPTTVMHDLTGSNCYTVTQPLLVLTSLASINVVQSNGGDTGGIDLRLTRHDTQAFATLTENRTGQQIALVVRGTVLSAPTIQQPILGGELEISGNYSQDDARRIVRQITG